LNNFYNNDRLIEQSIQYSLVYDDTAIFLNMRGLFSYSPFKDMKIKYKENPPPLNEITRDTALFEYLNKNNTKENNLLTIVSKYTNEKNVTALISIFSSLLYVTPLNWAVASNLSNLYGSLGEYGMAEYYLIYGYLVSDKNIEMTNDLEAFYKKRGTPEKIDEIKKLRDFPKVVESQ